MGVKACDRVDCENVMCDRCINGYYVCSSCAEEFSLEIGDYRMTRSELSSRFRNFLGTPKTCHDGSPIEFINVQQFLNRG